MRVLRELLVDKDQTGRRMYWLCQRYYRDLDKVFIRRNGRYVPVSQLSLEDYFDVVRSIPYRQDEKPIEVVARPRIVFENSERGADCKKKAVLIGAYLTYHKIPWRLVATSRRRDRKIHHVFPQALLEGEWVNLDGTYPHYQIGEEKRVTAAEVLSK